MLDRCDIMRINDVGYNYFHNADFRVERPCGSDDFLLLLLKTPAVFVHDGKEVTAETNSFILFNKSTPQICRANGMQFLNDWIHFDMSGSETKRFSKLGIPLDSIIQLEDINDISLIIKFMCHENYSTNLYRDRSAILYLRLLFLKQFLTLTVIPLTFTPVYRKW